MGKVHPPLKWFSEELKWIQSLDRVREDVE